MSLRQNLRYLRYIAVHKFYVGVACVREGIPVRAVTHDFSKFLPSEWRPYRHYFYGDAGDDNREANKGGKPDETGDRPFDLAWLLHQHRNRHHWQFYLLRKDDGSVVPLPMQELDMLEMLCDWYGAGAAITGDASWTRTRAWYEANAHKIVLHPMTKARVEAFFESRAPRKEVTLEEATADRLNAVGADLDLAADDPFWKTHNFPLDVRTKLRDAVRLWGEATDTALRHARGRDG